MRVEPDLNLDELLHTLRRIYDLPVDEVRFSPGGEDAYGYRVRTASGWRYYLKVYPQGRQSDAALRIAYALRHRLGFPAAVAPLKTKDGQLCASLDAYTLALFPLVNGPTAEEQPFTPAQHITLGRWLARLHGLKDAVIALRLNCPVERFDSPRRDEYLRVLEALPHISGGNHRYQRELAALLLPRRERLLGELEAFERAREQAMAVVESGAATRMLCHGDPTIGNVIAQGDTLHLIDWDGVILAPRERDLGHFQGAERQTVLKGYAQVAGPVTLNPALLEFYRLQWNIGEVIDFGTRLLFEEHNEAQQRHDLAEITRFLDYSGLA
jgi:spectinomycin phosphotransferase